MPEDISLSCYQDAWVHMFTSEASLIKNSLPHVNLRIHHVGSTSIPGLRAKPIIDINIESKEFPPGGATINKLDSIGYTNKGEAGITGRHWFVKGDPRTFHLHWCPCNGSVTLAQLTFRDSLRLSETLAVEYEKLKLDAAQGLTIDSSEYAEAKSDFIKKVIELNKG